MEHTLPARIRFGGFEFDLKTGELHGDGQAVRLTEKPFRVLSILVEHGGELATREEIQKKLWPNDTIVDFEHGINTAIKVLRRALGDSADAPRYIETFARRGYRLMVPVEWVEQLSVASSQLSEAIGAPAVRMQPDPGALTGRTVSHYRVLDIIGGGGMGVVYRAEDLKLGRRVALKFLPEELATDPLALQRFEREAQTASSLNHPNICTIYEVEEHDGQPFLVMELLEGETLRDRLTDASSGAQAVPLDELLQIAIQICDGLQAAHQKGIIHRDIKPANIFLTRKGAAKILDFGLAKLAVAEEAVPTPIEVSSRATRSSATADDRGVEGPAVPSPHEKADPSTPCPPGREDAAGEERGHFSRDDNSKVVNGTAEAVPLQNLGEADADSLKRRTSAEPTLTRTGLAMGTAGYMSPEQVRGEKLDARTDLFSFGLVLYEMATGQRAFNGDTAAVVREAILNSSPAPVRELELHPSGKAGHYD